MFKQTVKDWHRDDDSLTLILQRARSGGPPYFMATVVAVSVLVFMFVAATDSSATNAFGSLLVTLFGGFSLYCFIFATTTLRFDAGTLQLQTEWLRFHWPGRVEPFVVKSPRRIYDRNRLPKPVGRPAWFVRPTPERVYCYELRIPLADRGGRGIVCHFEDNNRLRRLEAEIDRFWAEVTLADESCSESASYSESPEPVESFKDYSFNRGEVFTGHGEEVFDHGAEPSVEKPQPIKGEQPIVTVRKKFHERRNEKSLTLISERGGSVGKCLGRTSLGFYWLLQLAFVIGLVYISVHWNHYWEHFEPTLVEAANRLNVEVLRRIDMPENEDTMLVEIMKRELKDDSLAFRIFFGLFFVLPIVAVLLCLSDVVLQFVRWPFWGRWKIQLRHSPRKPHLVTFDWRTDRRGSRSGRINYTPFFLAIPATPKTHRMVTGRRFWDCNSGWRRPFQVVIITPEVSFPLPVAGPEEQRHIIELLNEFIEHI